MKTSITFLIFLLFYNTVISQNKSQELEEAFNTEIYNFSNRVRNTYDGGIDAYNELYSVLDNGESRILKSQGEYSKLVPGWFDNALKLADKVVPGSGKIGKGATYLLEIGWKEHNDELEALRKQTALDGQIEVKKLVNNWKIEFEMRLSPFISNNNNISKFEKRNKDKFNKGTLKEKEQILKELQDYNKKLVKGYPVFAERNNAKAKIIAKIGVYEAYINHFVKIANKDSYIYSQEGYLIGYLDYDKNLNLIDKAIIPKVPSGIEIGKALNKLIIGIGNKPLDLNVYKIIYIHINGEEILWLTVFADNYIRYTLINKKNSYCFRYNQNRYLSKSQKSFLKNIGGRFDSKADRKCNYYSIKKSLFQEFTERNSSSFAKMPNSLKKLLDL